MSSTRLEEFLRNSGIKPAHLARESGYSRQHLLRIRKGQMEPTRACMAAIVAACRRLSAKPVRPEQLFDLDELRTLRKVLIIEDDELVALAITSYFTLDGISVRVLNRGAGAVEAVAEGKPDLVVLDVGLPDADGRTLCARIREQSEVPVILVSAVARALPSLPKVAFLPKPFGYEELRATVRSFGFTGP